MTGATGKWSSETTTPIASYTAIGDSFTEGVGDPGPDGVFVGWADRLARLLAERVPDHFHYANLAVRGRLLDQIITEQAPRAKEFGPELVTFCAEATTSSGAPDPDALAARYEAALRELRTAVGTVVVCTGFDTRNLPLLRHFRGRIATYNGHLRAIADRHGCPVLDLWSLRAVQDRRAWDEDRLHLSPEGHRRVAMRCAEVLAIEPPASPDEPWPGTPGPVASHREDLYWARQYLSPMDRPSAARGVHW